MNDELENPEMRSKGEGCGSQTPNPEPRLELGRRDLLKVITSVPAALASINAPAAQKISSEPPQSVKPTTPNRAEVATAYKRKTLNEHEYDTIAVLSDWIIPADERSGSAALAGVPQFIDDWLDFKGGRELDGIRGGITWLDLECNRRYAHDFLACSRDEQKQMLDRIAWPKRAEPEVAPGVAFFNQLRDLVVSGFFSSKMGVKDLPYLGNQMLASWEGCPPEVLARLPKI